MNIAPGEVGYSVTVAAIAVIVVALIIYLITRAIINVSDKPPAIALTIVLASITVLLICCGIAANSSQSLELAGVGLGALAGAVTATWRGNETVVERREIPAKSEEEQ